MRLNILNIGVSQLNSHYLNRKIRICNLMSVIVILAMLAYLPANEFYFKVTGSITLFNILLLLIAIANIFLHAKKQHLLAFHLLCSYLVLYFTLNPLFYGLSINSHFFQLVVCLIAIALFESKMSLRIYLSLATLSFFTTLIYMHNRAGLLVLTEAMEKNQPMVAIANLFLLFTIVAGFFSFFKRDNVVFQEAVLQQKTIIEAQRQKMMDSIACAKDIQSGLFASDDLLQRGLFGDRDTKEYFILFKPKDIVSGDFYWAVAHHGNFYLAVCDSTGHGVPGAFMSLLNIGFLSEAIKEKGITLPNEIFNYVRKRLIETIGKDGQHDGMDAILVCIHEYTSLASPKKITYSAANNHPVLMRKSTPIELPKDKMPVGGGNKSDNFQLFTLEYQSGDALYLFTDGYYDQFGGPKGKKLKYKHFITSLQEISSVPLRKQKYVLLDRFNEWRGNLEQVDDLLVFGIQL